jgi:hypothetical protein
LPNSTWKGGEKKEREGTEEEKGTEGGEREVGEPGWARKKATGRGERMTRARVRSRVDDVMLVYE